MSGEADTLRVVRQDDPALARAVRRAIVTEAEDLRHLGPWGTVHAVPLRRFPLLVQASAFEFEPLGLLVLRATPLAMVGAVPPDAAWIMLPLDGRRGLRLCGGAPRPDEIVLLGPGARYEAANPRDASYAVLRLPLARLADLPHLPPRCPLRRPGAIAWWRADAAALREATTLVHDADFVAQRDPGAFDGPEARRAFAHALLDAVAELMAPGGPRSRAPGAVVSRRIVQAADAALEGDPAGPVGAEALAAAIGVAPARLASAFAAVLGLTPERYMMKRRLLMFRAALRRPDPPAAPAEEVATRFGLTDGAALPRAYAALFGEPVPP